MQGPEAFHSVGFLPLFSVGGKLKAQIANPFLRWLLLYHLIFIWWVLFSSPLFFWGSAKSFHLCILFFFFFKLVLLLLVEGRPLHCHYLQFPSSPQNTAKEPELYTNTTQHSVRELECLYIHWLLRYIRKRLCF